MTKEVQDFLKTAGEKGQQLGEEAVDNVVKYGTELKETLKKQKEAAAH